MNTSENIKALSKKEQKIQKLKEALDLEKLELEAMKAGNIVIKNKYAVTCKFSELQLYNILANAGADKIEIKKIS